DGRRGRLLPGLRTAAVPGVAGAPGPPGVRAGVHGVPAAEEAPGGHGRRPGPEGGGARGGLCRGGAGLLPRPPRLVAAGVRAEAGRYGAVGQVLGAFVPAERRRLGVDTPSLPVQPTPAARAEEPMECAGCAAGI